MADEKKKSKFFKQAKEKDAGGEDHKKMKPKSPSGKNMRNKMYGSKE